MARPVMPRIYYKTKDPSVYVDEVSMQMIMNKYRQKGLNVAKLAQLSGITYDVARHFVENHHIRLSQLKRVVDALGLKVLYEQTGIIE